MTTQDRTEYQREYAKLRRETARRASATLHAQNIMALADIDLSNTELRDRITEYLLSYCKFKSGMVE